MTLPRLVLVHPRNADNLVSIARAMKCFGISDWVAVSSKAHLDGMMGVLVNHRGPEESGRAISSLRRVDTLAEAISDCSWVVGTTMRVMEGRLRLTPRELALETTRRRDHSWALVFGAECNGLQNDEVEQCHAVSFIPSDEAQPSLNLSQAVVVYGYELSCVSHPEQSGPALADDAGLRALRTSLVSGLVASRVMRGESSSRHDVEALMSSLMRKIASGGGSCPFTRAISSIRRIPSITKLVAV